MISSPWMDSPSCRCPDRRFPLSMGQRADIRVALPKEGGAFPVLALREGAVERTGLILASPGAAISKIAAMADAPGPVLSLDIEAQLQTAEPFRRERPTAASWCISLVTWRTTAGACRRPNQGAQGRAHRGRDDDMSMMAHPMHLHGIISR